MRNKMKLRLNTLKVKSFTTSLDESEKANLLGGSNMPTICPACGGGEPMPDPNSEIICTEQECWCSVGERSCPTVVYYC